MKKLTLFFCLVLLFAGSQTFAQLSKAEKKEWKKKAKEFKGNPEALKQLTDEKAAADAQVATMTNQVKQLQTSNSDKDARIAELEDQLSQARNEVSSVRAEMAQLKASPQSAPINPMDFSKGVVFKVQIGAFKNKDLSKYFENNPNFGGEAAGAEKAEQKLTIGVFRDYWEADTFKKYMRDMGVKDAWIVPYRDGQRVEIKNVLEGVVGDKAAAKTDGTN